MSQHSPPFDRAAVLRFMETHGMTFAEFVRHTGIGYHTGRRVLTEGGRPQAATATRIMDSLQRAPPSRPNTLSDEPSNEAIIRYSWGEDTSDFIGRCCIPPVSGARVRAIAKKLGLPPGGTRARKQTAE